MRKSVVLDIGGTSIKYGIVDEDGIIERKAAVPTLAGQGGRALMERIQSLVKELWDTGGEISSVGVATSGQVDVHTGTVRYATDILPGWTGMPIRSILEEAFHIPVFVENDVNAAALGEAWQGAARGKRDFIMVTLGTGIGGAIVIDGKIYYGSGGSAGEFGHIPIVPGGLLCTCGQRGCYEQYASTAALIKMYEAVLNKNQDLSDPCEEKISGEMIFKALEQGDPVACRVIEEWMGYIAQGLAAIVHIFNPDLILIGGGVSRQGASFIRQVEKKVKERIMPSFREMLRIRPAVLYNDAALLGAAWGALAYEKERRG